METKEQFEARSKATSKTAFETWLSQPMTRALISTIPPMENKDILIALLESAHQAGFGCGQGSILVDMVGIILKETRKP